MREQVKKAAIAIRRLRLSQIRTNAGTQSRVQIDEPTVADYAERMIAGDRFPPVVVFFDGCDYILSDGFHRFRAARQARFETIQADVRRGTRTDALKFSLAANHSHGLRRTNADKQHAIEIALKEFTDWSDRRIADLVGVTQPTVSAQRRELKDFISCDEGRLGRDGKRRRLPTPSNPILKAQTLPLVTGNGHDGAAQRAVLEIARQLACLEDAIRAALARYPDAKPLLLGFVAKTKQDLGFLEKEIAKPEVR